MSHPLEATLEDRDDHWVLTFTRDFVPARGSMWPWITDPV